MFDLMSLVKYVLEGTAVALAAFYIPRKNMNMQEVLMIALTAAAVFAVLDLFAPAVGSGARHGSGFGIGYNLVTGGAADDATDTPDTEEEPTSPPPEDYTLDEDSNADVPEGNDMGENFASL